jgi:hypothetical protein
MLVNAAHLYKSGGRFNRTRKEEEQGEEERESGEKVVKGV